HAGRAGADSGGSPAGGERTMSAVYVWIETFQGRAQPGSWEALGAASKLGLPVVALVFGKDASAIAQEAARYGAERCMVSEDATLESYRLEPYAALLSKLVQDNRPRLVIASATLRGRELLAASAADTNCALLSDVMTFEVNDGTVTATRAAYAGKVLSDVDATGETVFLTLRGRAFKAQAANEAASAQIETVEPVLAEAKIATKIEGFEAEAGGVNLSDAAIIVSGGRGMANNPKPAPPDAADAAVWKAQDGFKN